VHGHRLPGMRTVTLSFKRVGFAPGDADADTMDALAQLAEQFSAPRRA
jgi:sulfite reductase (NADPH) hemoprotein beta-component